MKYCFIFVVISLVFVFSIFGQPSKSPQISAKVEKFIREEKEDWIVFEVDLKFEFKNTLSKRVFLLKDNFSFYGIEVFRRSAINNNLESVLRNQHPPSFSGNAKWIKVGEEIMRSKTKSKYLISLSPNESISFERKYTFGFQTENYTNYGRNFSWGEVMNEKTLFLKFDVNVWESEIRTKSSSSKLFPINLAKKMKKQGVLWFENIKSEPIPLNLSSAVVKTAEK